MKLTAFKEHQKSYCGIVHEGKVVSLQTINYIEGKNWSIDLDGLLKEGQWEELVGWYRSSGRNKLSSFPYRKLENLQPDDMLLCPGKTLGVGMNYVEKAMELTGEAPKKEPVTFMKPPTTLIGPGAAVQLPKGSTSVAAEGELAIIIGKTCRDIEVREAQRFIAGYTTALDMTEKDIHRADDKYLQWSKSFDTFCSLGSDLVSGDHWSSLEDVIVKTTLNGKVTHENTVGNMMYSPAFIVSFFSKIMTLQPGDVILTGTPGSNMIHPGDRPGCLITGLDPLENPVERKETRVTVL
ncbi:fumarylacetoacetate hydrolase family protein [Bacillus sp. SB49]|uniref:fumarylacetoacetate hydrolase family protein n=1 Tax=Bacillus sp. SB49 TaxID=1071080 RepID=UPI00047DA828|nr:fumarylacetoacetate hydrolase family protein [Bacillus sp. SB49]QHT47646.1 fumarylacetoacetate hydrolase family protein [Bacillus sp. SB49]